MTLIRPASREYRIWAMDSRRWEGYQPRPDDVIIATPPKCGTTWMQHIVCSLVFQDPTPRALPEVSPWIDQRFVSPIETVYGALERQTHRRFVKSHLPLDGLPLYDDVKYIHVARDGRDAIMSLHNHHSGFNADIIARFDRIGLEDPAIGRALPRVSKEPDVFFRQWISESFVSGQTDGFTTFSFFDTVASYWAERRRPNFLLVHYNDLLADRQGEMRRIAAFLGIEVAETLWPALVDSAGFTAMQDAGATLMPQTERLFPDGGARRFFNKGTNQRWREVLTADDLARYAAKVAEKFTPALAAWVEGGRLASADPRTSPD